jgi:elongation factor 1-gamma
LGENNFDCVLIAQWLDFIAQNFFIPGHPIIAHACGCGKAPSKGVRKEATEKIAAAMEIFNSHLKHYTYLVGERVSIADISLATIIESLNKKHFTDDDRSKFKSVFRLYKHVSAQPQYQTIFGNLKPKVKSTFNLEEWKRKYMNTDPRTESIPYFFEKVDRKVNVVYFCEYKYPEDCQKSFMTRNLIQGVMNRFSASTKIGFGTFVILGAEEKHTFKGMFVFESPDGEIPKIFSDVDDFEIFDWRKGDFEADKERISDFLAWDKPIDGMPFLDGKVFR